MRAALLVLVLVVFGELVAAAPVQPQFDGAKANRRESWIRRREPSSDIKKHERELNFLVRRADIEPVVENVGKAVENVGTAVEQVGKTPNFLSKAWNGLSSRFNSLPTWGKAATVTGVAVPVIGVPVGFGTWAAVRHKHHQHTDDDGNKDGPARPKEQPHPDPKNPHPTNEETRPPRPEETVPPKRLHVFRSVPNTLTFPNGTESSDGDKDFSGHKSPARPIVLDGGNERGKPTKD